jgi:hypothetical protein
MWTICWNNAGNEEGEINGGWEKWATRDDVIARANTLVRECDVCESDILIFPPKSDKFTIPYDSLEC